MFNVIIPELCILVVLFLLHYFFFIKPARFNDYAVSACILLCLFIFFTFMVCYVSNLSSLYNMSSPIILLYSTVMPCIYGLLSVDVNFLHMGGRALLPMLFIVILAIYYTVAFMDSEIKNFIIYCGLLYICGFMLVVTSSTILMFVAFEGILIPTSIVLDKFSKTVRGRDATLSMILLTQVGAMLLFFIIIIVLGVLSTNTILDSAMPLSRSATNLIFILLLLGFGTKMPIWPFYYWLPEAHVEVSTNFSIILSGLSIKFAFLGFLKFISVFGCGDLYWLAIILCSFGSIDAALRMDTESDIKKIVAYQTVIEMQLLIIFTVIGCNEFLGLILFILQAHCWISTIEFIIVDIIMKRYHSRNLEQLYGIFAESPRIVKFIFFIVFILGSFPGTSIFSVEFLIQISFTTIPFNILLFIFLNFFTVIWSKNAWWALWGGDSFSHALVQSFNFTKAESYLIYILIIYLVPALLFFNSLLLI